MMDKIRNWYSALSNREQWLVAIAASLAAAVIAIYGVAMPLYNAVDRARAEHDEAVLRRGRIEAKVASVGNRTQPAASVTTTDVEAFVMQSAIEQGFDALKGAGTAGSVSVKIEQARAAALFGWLETLAQQGIEVNALNVRKTSSGGVSVDLQVGRGAK